MARWGVKLNAITSDVRNLTSRQPLVTPKQTQLGYSMHFRHLYWSLAAFISFASQNAATCTAAETALKSGIERSTFDLSVKPGDDFFQYVNGNWIKRNPIPPEYSRWGAFPKLRDDNLLALREILDDLSKQPEPFTDDRRKLRDFYRTAMDEPTIQRLGASPLQSSLEN